MEQHSHSKYWVRIGVWDPICCDKVDTVSHCPVAIIPCAPESPRQQASPLCKAATHQRMWPLFSAKNLAISDFVQITNIPQIYLFVYVCTWILRSILEFHIPTPGYTILHLLKPLFKMLIHINQKYTHKPHS